MIVNYRLIKANELDQTLIDKWRSIQSGRNIFSSPYFCPEFTQLVASVRSDVRVVVIENGGRPVGFFPHQRASWGSGKPVGGPLSDYHGVIAEAGSEWEPDALLRAANLSAWTFDHLIDDSDRFEPYSIARAISPQIDLHLGYEHYVQAHRATGSLYINKTEGLARKLSKEVGELNFTLHEERGTALAQLVAWKREQYRQARLTDAFAVSWTGELLDRIAQTQTEAFAGVCSVLRAGDQVVSVHMGMRSRGELHYWFPAYDPVFAKYSTGIILLLRVAEAMAGLDVRSIDLGKGETQYKQRLMSGSRELLEGFVERPSMLAQTRQLQRMAEAYEVRGKLPELMRLPLRAVRRIKRMQKYR